MCLNATPEEILERVKHETHRPLLEVDDPLGAIRALLEYRAPFYAKVSHQVDTTGKPLEAVVEEVVAIWRRESE